MFRNAFGVVKPIALGLITMGLAIGPLVAEAGPSRQELATAAALAQDQPGPRPPVNITFRPDLVITKVSTTELGDCQRMVKATIKNNPSVVRLGARAGAFKVALLSSGNVVDLETVSGLDVGQSKTVTLFGSGETSEWVSVDWGNKQKESKEDNNTSRKQIIVC
jgi:hypothetical protein